jgi:glyoxylase-like metal-dependent hydrolase (beta-lactamase superfamily II)
MEDGRWQINALMQPSLVGGRIHVVDGGYTSTAPGLSAQIKRHYGTTTTNNVVVTHPDKDHAEGLAPILEVTLAFQGGFVLFQTADCFGLRFVPVEQPVRRSLRSFLYILGRNKSPYCRVLTLGQ